METVRIPEAGGVQDLIAWTMGEPELQAWIKDLRSRFVVVSRPLARSCGVQPQEMAGRTEMDFFPKERVRQFRLDDLRAVALNQALVVEESGTRGGRFATLKRPLRDLRGQLLGTIGIAYDWPADRREPPLVPPRDRVRAEPPWLSDFWQRMQRDFRNAVNLRRLAAEVGRHPNHISRAFRSYYGISLVECVHRLRVAWAGESLMCGELPLSTLAQRAGFADQSHLTRIFKRYYGLTPGQYRQAASLAGWTGRS